MLETRHLNLLTARFIQGQLVQARFTVRETFKFGRYLPLMTEFLGEPGLGFERWLQRTMMGGGHLGWLSGHRTTSPEETNRSPRQIVMRLASRPYHHLALGRMLRFASVGLLATAVYYAILCVLVEVLSFRVLPASGFAFTIVAVENYFLHYHWTFRSNSPHPRALASFLSMNLVGFGMNWAIMFAGTRILNINYLVVQAVAIAAIIAWNFIASSLWIFGQRHRQ